MRIQLTNILSQFQALASVDTEGVEPTGHTTDSHTIMRTDEPHPPLERDDVLQNAPDRDGEFVRVRPVLE
jgi:aspartyl-tRNA(Asn)/glutamyl-tRNA(Gln) amidotransferase subunit C